MTATATATLCPLCGAAQAEPLTVGYDRMRASARDFAYVRCGGCGLARQEPLPELDEIPGLYPDDYDPHVGGGGRKKDRWINRMATRYYYGTDSAGRSPLLRFLFRLLSVRVMPGTRPPRGGNALLDVGCGAGDLLCRYRDLGWSVRGVELSPRATDVARGKGLEVHQGNVYDAPLAPASFDMLILSHVIEHVLEPARFLTRCRELLRPGGLLICLTPNVRAMGFAIYGSCWFPLEAPRHLMLFDPGTIRLLGEQAGLRVHRVRTLAEPRRYCESRHYADTQGRILPPDIEERRRILADSAAHKEERRAFRSLVRPFAAIAALFGRGEILEAEFVREG